MVWTEPQVLESESVKDVKIEKWLTLPSILVIFSNISSDLGLVSRRIIDKDVLRSIWCLET